MKIHPTPKLILIFLDSKCYQYFSNVFSRNNVFSSQLRHILTSYHLLLLTHSILLQYSTLLYSIHLYLELYCKMSNRYYKNPAQPQWLVILWKSDIKQCYFPSCSTSIASCRAGRWTTWEITVSRYLSHGRCHTILHHYVTWCMSYPHRWQVSIEPTGVFFH